MATTAKPIDFLVSGVRDTTGAVVASGKVRWYLPATLTPAVVYSDAACTTPITAPLTLNAGGQGVVYCLEPVRVIVKDTTESVTYYDDIAPLQRHDSVYITHPSYNSGAETTLETVLGTFATNLGVDFKYKESAGATSVTYTTWLGELAVSVKDFGAVGDGTTDDTVAIQAASDRVKARGGGWVYIPVGTYKITSAISIDTVGVCWRGAGRKSTIKNFSTSGNAVSLTFGAVDSKSIFRDFAITANTTSSGYAILVNSGNRFKVENVATALHRNGIVVSGSEAQLLGCTVESGDDNASQIGLAVSTRGRVDNCNVISGTTNGTGILLPADSRAIDCYVEKWGGGYALSGAGAQARGCVGSLNTTGFQLSAANTIAEACLASGAGTGYSVGAFATCSVTLSRASACTTDLSVNASATLFEDRGNSFTGTVTNAATSPVVMPFRMFFSSTTSASATPTLTPDISAGKNFNLIICTAASPVTLTLANHATATLAIGDILIFTAVNTGNATLTMAYGAQYLAADGTAAPAAGNSVINRYLTTVYRWNGTNFIEFLHTQDQPS